MFKKVSINFIRLLGIMIGFAGIMGLYFSYTFNTKDTELAYLSIFLNVVGIGLYALGTFILEQPAFNLKKHILRLIVFTVTLVTGLLIFYFFRYPGDIILTAIGCITLISEIRVINSFKNNGL